MKKSIRYIIIGLIICVLVGGGGILVGTRLNNKKEAELSAVVIKNQLSAVSELATMTYGYTNMAHFENSSEFYGVKVPFTTKSFIITYDGTIKAGIDLNKVEINVSGNKIKIKLPGAEILSHEIDENSIEIFDEKKSIFNPFTVVDYTSFCADQKLEMEKKALKGELLTKADEQAQTALQLLISQTAPEGCSIEFE